MFTVIVAKWRLAGFSAEGNPLRVDRHAVWNRRHARVNRRRLGGEVSGWNGQPHPRLKVDALGR